jgi:hypothetical protein
MVAVMLQLRLHLEYQFEESYLTAAVPHVSPRDLVLQTGEIPNPLNKVVEPQQVIQDLTRLQTAKLLGGVPDLEVGLKS